LGQAVEALQWGAANEPTSRLIMQTAMAVGTTAVGGGVMLSVGRALMTACAGGPLAPGCVAASTELAVAGMEAAGGVPTVGMTAAGTTAMASRLAKSASSATDVAQVVRQAQLELAAARAGANGGGKVAGEIATPVTSGGTANVVTVPGLKGQLAAENLANIAAQDARLAKAASGSGVPNPNFSVGSGTATEANSLGQIWVGDGARPLSGVPGGLMSADGTRIYRPPTAKKAPVEFNPTGVQANFQMRDPNTGAVTSNGHMVIK
jgi:hypothetical protein